MLKLLKIFLTAAGLSATLSACFDSHKVVKRPAESGAVPPKQEAPVSFYSLKVRPLDGGDAVSLEQFRGKKLVILNVASKCGYTPQYADWQAFYETHKDSIAVLGFPCNDFMGQEPGDASEIEAFCQKNYGVSFPMFEKVHVKGAEQSPVYQWLSDPARNGWNSEVPSWNFCKYLIDENGTLTHFFASGVLPDDPQFVAAIRK